MKLRHAAALALVGWYLFLPVPSQDDPDNKFDLNAPLAVWYQAHDQYSTRIECESFRDALLRQFGHGKGYEFGRCISSDDPQFPKTN